MDDRENETTPVEKNRLTVDMPTKKPRGFKIALGIMAVLLVLFVCTIVFLPYFLPIGTIRGIAQSRARELAGLHVDFANLRFGWNGDVVLDDIAVAPLTPAGEPGETLLAVDEVRTNVALAPLLSGNVVVNSVDVHGFTLTLRRDAEGKLNLPDFENLPGASDGGAAGEETVASAAHPAADGTPLLLSAALAAEEPVNSSVIPPIELRQINLLNGLVLFTDETRRLNLDIGVAEVNIEGGSSLDEPFALAGSILPYSQNPELGAIDFTGTVALLKNAAFDPEGQARIEAALTDFALGALAEKLGLAQLLPSGTAEGTVRLGYADRKAGLVVPEMRFADMVVGIGSGALLSVPDTQATLDLAFAPETDTLTVASASVKNDILDVTASGGAANVSAAAAGGLPGAELDFGGTVDFSRASHFVSSQDLAALLGLPELPELEGRGGFTGAASLPSASAGEAPAPTLSLSFGEGEVRILENNTGVSAGVELRGISAAANAELAAVPAVHARVDFTQTPVRAFVPQFGDSPVTVTLAGGAAFEMTADAMAAELRADGAGANIPATPWSQAAAVTNVSAHVTADIAGDEILVHSASMTINDGLSASAGPARLAGVFAGNPEGTAEARLSGLLQDLRALLRPVYPAELLPQLEGNLRSSARLTLGGGRAEAMVNSEIDGARAIVTVDPASGARADFRAAKSTVGVLASLDTRYPERIDVRTFEASAPEAEIAYADAAGRDAAGRLGGALLKFSGALDTSAMTAALPGFSLDLSGLSLGFARGGETVATLVSGLMKAAAGTVDQPVIAPLSGAGDFAVPQMDIGADNLAFSFVSGGRTQESRIGSVRARLGADGYVGSEKRQIINIRTASLAATPVAINSRAQLDLGSGAFLAEYAARIAPAGLAPVLAFLGLPPALLTNATATGTVAFDGGNFTAKGAANGELNTGQGGGVTPFETAHDLSAVWNPADSSLTLEIRRLDGNLKTPSGEAAATMAAQPSRLFLSGAGSRGMIDVRFNGSAGPTRALALGLAGVLPQLGGVAGTLASAQAGGVYSAWAQIREKDPATLGFSVGGTWRGAALSLDGAPFLSEAGELSAALEGDLAYQANAVRVSRLLLRSESAQMEANGTAEIRYAAGADRLPTGLAGVGAELRFSAADIALAGRVFPGILPPEMGLTGGVQGVLAAAGDAANVRISRGAVNFRNFRAVPAEGLEVTIPQGEATFGASRVALKFGAPGSGSDYGVFRMIDVFDGRAAVTGALVRGRQVNTMAAAFALRDGVLSLNDAQLVVGGGADGQIALTGAVDFTRPAPAADVRLAIRNFPLAEVNSEIADYMQIQQGALHIPAQQGQAASVAFEGFSEDEILRTLRLGNFNFATGPVTLETGPALNAELDKARVLLRMGDRGERARVITFASVDGGVEADGTGVISFPESRPINVVGDNTADFRAQGAVRADHTIDMRVMVAGNIQKMVTIPNLVPNLSLGQGGEGLNLMERMNRNAAAGNYGVHVTGALESPDISGIGALAGQFLKDVLASVPTQLIGNVIGAPESAVKLGENIIQGITNPQDALKNAPENLLRGIGGMFGVGGAGQQEQQPQGQTQQPQAQQGAAQQQQSQQQSPERQLLQGLGRLIGGNR